jgi:hypothetical protein
MAERSGMTKAAGMAEARMERREKWNPAAAGTTKRASAGVAGQKTACKEKGEAKSDRSNVEVASSTAILRLSLPLRKGRQRYQRGLW